VSGKQLSGALLSNGFSNIYENATDKDFQITFKSSKEVENLQKQKLFNFSSSTLFRL
jgi:hypothetical protein